MSDATDITEVMELGEDMDAAVGEITLPGRVRAGARTLVLTGMVYGVGALGAFAVLQNTSFPTISLGGVGA